ncbi:hypothetical protein ACIQJT_38175 [Streptomyces sp. NPDC091972]|uniref:hypothetical protein n=1 Tax=Streptomyces sp. NPDC091972 TaxID=3366007 RepID=UPI0037FE6372
MASALVGNDQSLQRLALCMLLGAGVGSARRQGGDEQAKVVRVNRPAPRDVALAARTCPGRRTP